MKFVRVSKIAEKLNMDVAIVFEMAQKKLFEKKVYWLGKDKDKVIEFHSSTNYYHEDCNGLVLILEDGVITYASEDFCVETYDNFYTDNFLQIKVKDFDIIYNNTVELSGEYTKEQLQEILNNMEE